MINAMYPGSFDPITNGHLDIIKRASKLYDKLYIGVSDEESAKNRLFSIDDRISLATEALSHMENVEVIKFRGLLVKKCEGLDCSVIVRGLRALSDYDYEFKMALMNRTLNNEIITLFMMPHEKYTHVSSSLIKEVSSLGGDMSKYVPEHVQIAIKEKFGK
mgnify:FL=1